MNRSIMKRCVIAMSAAALLVGATGCGMLTRPSAQVTGVDVRRVGLTEATMVFDVKVDNPYTVALPMSNLDYALSSRGVGFLTGEADVAGTVPAGGSKTLGVPVRISYRELIAAVRDARPGAVIPYRADLGLSVQAPALGPIRLPIRKDGELTIPSAPELLDRLKDLAR